MCTLLKFHFSHGETVPKILEAKRTTQRVVIDGKLDESAWQDAAKADDYVELRPVIGRKELYANRTETFLMHSDDGLYFGGTRYERTVDSIGRWRTAEGPDGTVLVPSP